MKWFEGEWLEKVRDEKFRKSVNPGRFLWLLLMKKGCTGCERAIIIKEN